MYQRKDPFYRRAKAQGYRSRAAFKLLQLGKGSRLLRPGDRVIDLGAWPGGWLEVASQQVGPSGRVVGVDIRPIAPLRANNVTLIAADVTDPGTIDRVADACGGKVDVILADLAPKVSGIRARDEAQTQVLTDCVLGYTRRLLKPGGRLVMKLFTGHDLARYVSELRLLFQRVRVTRPQATRKASSETYAVAIGFRSRADNLGCVAPSR